MNKKKLADTIYKQFGEICGLEERVKHLEFVSKQKQKHIRGLERSNYMLRKILESHVHLSLSVNPFKEQIDAEINLQESDQSSTH